MLCNLPDEELLEMIAEMKQAGMCGLEAVYSENTADDEAHMKKLAEEFDLCVTGGSDFHGKQTGYPAWQRKREFAYPICISAELKGAAK